MRLEIEAGVGVTGPILPPWSTGRIDETIPADSGRDDELEYVLPTTIPETTPLREQAEESAV